MIIEEIKNKLRLLGANDKEINQALADVNEIIAERIISFYVSRLSEKQQEELTSLSKEDVQRYLERNKDQLPPFAKDEFEKISQETWGEYFSRMSK